MELSYLRSMNMMSVFLRYAFTIVALGSCAPDVFAKYPKHSIMPMLGLANTGINDYSLRVSHGLQVSYTSGDRLRTPMGIRYQYRMKKGNIVGLDLVSVYSPMIITPQYLDPSSGFGGPAMTAGRNMAGGNIHYSKTIDIKLLEIFGMAGFGGYFTGARSNIMTTDYSWYKGANADFYDFAPEVTNKAFRKFMPVIAFGFGVRFRHLEAGLHNQVALSGPIKDFSFNGYSHSVPLHWKSIGYYVGYRFEF
jgi:hypothetical protein